LTAWSIDKGYTPKSLNNKIDVPDWIIMDYELITNMDFFEGDIYSLNQKINELKKQKHYTAALINIIHFFINSHLVPLNYFIEPPANNYKKFDFQDFSFRIPGIVVGTSAKGFGSSPHRTVGLW
jgi:hypothetical protein